MRNLITLFRYFHTLRFLKLSQIIFRLKRKFIYHRNLPIVEYKLRKQLKNWYSLALRKQSYFYPNDFILINERGSINKSEWTDSSKSQLWQYNLHYFDDLNSEVSSTRSKQQLELISNWIKYNKATINIAWDPYPTSIRIVNWIKFHFHSGELNRQALDNLASQSAWLYKNIEWHILGNHLFVNAKALIFSGLFFEGISSERWLKKGLEILRVELPEQFNSDGMHYELSPMYHALILEDLLDLINLFIVYEFVEYEKLCRKYAYKAYECLEEICHPDGEIPFFNDATLGVAATKKNIKLYASKLGIKSEYVKSEIRHFEESGYIILRSNETFIICDIGHIGPNYIPSHAHADTLSFEFSLFGHRLIVNSGISEYGNGPERVRQRGTKAHSTLNFNDLNSTDVWQGFRVAKRAKPLGLEVKKNKINTKISCAHDGYKKIIRNSYHFRKWEVGDNYLKVSDNITGFGKKLVEINFHLHPDVIPKLIDNNKVLLILPCGKECTLTSLSGHSIKLIESTWHPGFNIVKQNFLIQIKELLIIPHSFEVLFQWAQK